MVPLRFRAALLEPVANPDPWQRHRGGRPIVAEDRVVRSDGATGSRRVIIHWFPPDEEHTTAEVSLTELHPAGKRSSLMKRRRVDRPSTNHGQVQRFKPLGQGLSLQDRLHWPPLDCVLQGEDILVGQLLPLFGYPLRVLGPEDEPTRRWLEARALPGADLKLPPSDIATTYAASGEAASVAAAPPRVEETLSFFLGGPRPHAASRPTRGRDAPMLNPEADETARIRHNQLTPMPSLRERPAVQGKDAPPLPSEVEAYERSRRYGNTRVLFKAREAQRTRRGETAEGGRRAMLPPPAARSFLLEFYVADDTLAVSELHVGSAGSQFARRHGAVVGSGGETGFERTPFLRRGRQPKDLSAYLSGVGYGHAPPIGGGGGYGRGGEEAAYVGLQDLRCGAEVSVAGTRMRIVCCEPSSRALLVGKGLAMELGVGFGSGAGPGQAMFPGEDEESWAAVPAAAA